MPLFFLSRDCIDVLVVNLFTRLGIDYDKTNTWRRRDWATILNQNCETYDQGSQATKETDLIAKSTHARTHGLLLHIETMESFQRGREGGLKDPPWPQTCTSSLILLQSWSRMGERVRNLSDGRWAMGARKAGEDDHHVAKEEGRVAGADGAEGIDSAEAVDMELGHMVGVEAGGGVVGHGVDAKIASGKVAAEVDVGGEDVELTAEEAGEDGTSGDVESGAVEAEEDAGVVGRYESVVVVVHWKNKQGQGFAATCRAGDRRNSLRFAINDKVIESWCRVQVYVWI